MEKIKITLIRKDNNNQLHRRVLSISDFIKRIQHDTKNGDVLGLRRFLWDNRGNADARYYKMFKLPRVYPCVETEKDIEGELQIRRYNGVIVLDVNNLRNTDETEQVKNAAMLLPMTLAAFKGSSNKSVKILVVAKHTDDTVPQGNEARGFYRRAYETATRIYGSILPHPITMRNTDVDMLPSVVSEDDACSFRMTHDEHPLFNPDAVSLRVPMMVGSQEARVEGRDHPQPLPDGRRVSVEGNVGYTVEKQDKNSERISQETHDLVNFMQSNYEMRYNTIMGYTEYRRRGTLTSFQPVDERTRNSFSMEARMAGLNIWDKDINRIIASNLVKNYNPVEEYLWRVHTKWDRKDHIRALARRVPTDNPHWEDWFYTWFLGMVAQWIGYNKKYGNSTAPLLISKQGFNKSTFCKSLIPEELQWGYNDSLVLSEKKAVLQAMSQFLLINLDEFNAISPKIQEGFLKNLIQLASVKVKRPYGKHVEEFPRMASFIATANMTDILADPSGCRRFIGIELTGPIKVGKSVNHEQLYAQAYNAIIRHEQYWFDDKQTALIMKNNRQFQMTQPIEQVFFDYFDIVSDEQQGEYMTAATIFTHIKKEAGSTIRNTNLIAFGRWLKNLEGLRHKGSNQGTKYLVCKKQA